jgi:sulfatase maturation enzyme AslB (radical SAM superfamily)
MARFRGADAFAPAGNLQLLPLRFERLRNDRYLVSNLIGDALHLTRRELDKVVGLDLAPGDGLYERAFEKLLVAAKGQKSQLQLLAMRLRSRMAFLQDATPLHLFVVTLRCEHSCPYCQVSRRSVDRERFDMSPETAMRALRVALSAPAPTIKIEFQGGEPLLNFPLIKQIVAAARRDKPAEKNLEFVIV